MSGVSVHEGRGPCTGTLTPPFAVHNPTASPWVYSYLFTMKHGLSLAGDWHTTEMSCCSNMFITVGTPCEVKSCNVG